MIQLDSNIAIALLNRTAERVRARFDAARANGTTIAISIVVFHELTFGAAASEQRERNEAKIALLISQDIAILPFEEADARHAADIRAHLRRLGTPIGPYDVFIAAQARRVDATLVTSNGREFERVPGLRLTDWAKSA
jgi:tRNA(fMet)-specific endonuclease VapC